MMPAMPAYAIRKEREKKKSRTKVVAGRGVYQLRPPRASRNSISSMKGVYKRPQFNRSSQDHLKSSTDLLAAKRRSVPLYYAGTAFMCAGLVLVFVSVAINDQNTRGAGKPIRYVGLALLVFGGLICLIKVLCFSSQDPNHIIFVRRTDHAVIEESTPSEEDASSSNGLPAAVAPDDCSDSSVGFNPAVVPAVHRQSTGYLLNHREEPATGDKEIALLRVSNEYDGQIGANCVSASSGTTLQMNGLSPSSSSQGACSTQVLITPDSVVSAKF